MFRMGELGLGAVSSIDSTEKGMERIVLVGNTELHENHITDSVSGHGRKQ